MTPVAFGTLALLLAGPIPAWLAASRWPQRAPRAALVLWQAVAIAAVFSAFSCGLAIASRVLLPGPDGRPTQDVHAQIATLGWPMWVFCVSVFALTLLVGARLSYSAVRLAVSLRARRARHRMLVDLLTSDRRIPEHAEDDLRLLAAEERFAYCLPGLRHRLVLSHGTVDSLAPSELEAVISHERAHLRARHDLILEAFTAIYEAFPRFVRSAAALTSVRMLVEMLADDHARSVVGAAPVARALIALADTAAPAGAIAAGGEFTLDRVHRLCAPEPSPWISVPAYLAASVVLVFPTIALAVPWLEELSRLLR
ncbi:MAG: M56 family metallopeptidase [Segniliparus sp.]|uniref:M56 family metallopeptidase n=1 Tax=Segniliparus sp. TaxID=2804064 RepID=UPI003F39B794